MSTDKALPAERLNCPCVRFNAKFRAQNRLKNRAEIGQNFGLFWSADFPPLLGGGLEPPRLTAYAPQTYVSAISPPERSGTAISIMPKASRKRFNYAGRIGVS